jgi:hypothetical protein
MPEPVNTEMYARAKAKANQTYGTHTSAYRSMAIQKYYKAMGGTYRDDGGDKKLQTWRKEKWVDLNQEKKGGGYEVCGHKNTQNNKYPLCRPSKTINKDSPKKYQDISKSDIRSTNFAKQRIKGSGNISFSREN